MPRYPNKPWSESCDQNRDPILAVLREVLSESSRVLEIGAGTGQHAAYFPGMLPHLTWHPTDVAENLPGIEMWIEEAGLSNVSAPQRLDVSQPDWPEINVDAVFSANTAHIMSWPQVCSMFAGVGRLLNNGGRFCLYGPFNYHGKYTSESNARFDQWLKARDPLSGIREFDDLLQLAQASNMDLYQDFEMPVNNRILVFDAS